MKLLHIALLTSIFYSQQAACSQSSSYLAGDTKAKERLQDLRNYYSGHTLNNPKESITLILRKLDTLNDHIAEITSHTRTVAGYHKMFIQSPQDSSLSLEDFLCHLLDMKEQIEATKREYLNKMSN